MSIHLIVFPHTRPIQTTPCNGYAAPIAATVVPVAPPTCAVEPAFGAINGQTALPVSGSPWAFSYQLKQNAGSTYTGGIVIGAISYVNGATGGCSSPGAGGGCGTTAGTLSLSFASGKVSATVTASGSAMLVSASIRYSCSSITDRGASSAYQITSGLNACGASSLTVSGSVPTCSGNKIYVMVEADVVADPSNCSIAGCTGARRIRGRGLPFQAVGAFPF